MALWLIDVLRCNGLLVSFYDYHRACVQGMGQHTAGQVVLKAHVECGISVRCEDSALLAHDILGLAVLVPCRVRDLFGSR